MIERVVLLIADVTRLVDTPPPGPARTASLSGWVDPRNSVLLILVLALILGGGRKLLQGLHGRQAAERLGDASATSAEIEAAAEHGRAALVELFGLLDASIDRARRMAAGRALARLWAEDQLIAEEEKAVATRGFEVTWRARRRYPRRMRAPIPIAVEFGLPFLDESTGVRPENLAWSYRVAGSRRALLEQFGPFEADRGRLVFQLEPDDFSTEGPHRLSFQARVRTQGLTTPWELNLPHVAFAFEFDPNLDPASLLTLADADRGEALARAVALAAPPDEQPEPRFVPLGNGLAWQDAPQLLVSDPPCDLAHRLTIEFEGVEGHLEAGSVVIAQDRLATSEPREARFAIEPAASGTLALERPGEYRARAVLTADPDLGWADPDVRSLWPGTIATPWAIARLVRL